MSTSTTTTLGLPEQQASRWLTRLADYVELTKPKIAVMSLVTVVVSGVVARWGHPDLLMLLHAVVGTTLVAASASAMNHWMERDRDLQMERTANRPLPAGRLTAGAVLTFAATSLCLGVAYLAISTNALTTLFGLLTWFFYVCLYTPMKRRTTANTAVGAVAGALPTMIGWAAVGGTMDVRAAAMFLIVFLWQFPHFMAIAWLYRRQYSKAGFRMLTVADPSGRRAGVQAVLSALALLPVSLVPAMLTPGMVGPTYLVTAFLLGLGQLICAVGFCLQADERSARRLLRASLIYLPALMGLMILTPTI